MILKNIFVLTGLSILCTFSIFAQNVLEVDGDTDASLILKTADYFEPTIVEFQSGITSDGHTHMRLINQSDVIQFELTSSDIFTPRSILRMSATGIVTIPNLGNNGNQIVYSNNAGSLYTAASSSIEKRREFTIDEIYIASAPVEANLEQTAFYDSYTTFPGITKEADSGDHIVFQLLRPEDYSGSGSIFLDIYYYSSSTNNNVEFFFIGAEPGQTNISSFNNSNSLGLNNFSSSSLFAIQKITIDLSAAVNTNREIWSITGINFGANAVYVSNALLRYY